MRQRVVEERARQGEEHALAWDADYARTEERGACVARPSLYLTRLISRSSVGRSFLFSVSHPMAAFDGCTAHARRSDEIKVLIKTTTSDMMIAPDWGANMTLVDLVNGTHNAKVRISASSCARACASRCAPLAWPRRPFGAAALFPALSAVHATRPAARAPENAADRTIGRCSSSNC